MKIEDIQHQNGRHYLMTWIASFRVLLGWDERRTLAWAGKWRKELNHEAGASDWFYTDAPMDFVSDELMAWLILRQPGMDRNEMRQKLSSALLNFQSLEGKANWDLFSARRRVENFLAEYEIRLPAPLVPGNGKTLRKSNQGESPWPDYQFLLLASTEGGCTRQMERYLEKGAEINGHGATNWTPLMEACRHHRLNALKLLIGKGAKLNACTQDGRGVTALMIAAENGDEECLRILIKAGADLELKDHEGQSALHFATRSGREGSIRILINAGAGIPQKKADLCSLLWLPSFEGRLDILKQFKKAGARIKDCAELLVVAAEADDIKLARFFLNAGVDVNEVHDEAWPRTALMAAAHRGYEDIARLLLKFGADVKASTGAGRDAMSWAREKKRRGIIKLLE
jgi:ankyrin repeat protein